MAALSESASIEGCGLSGSRSSPPFLLKPANVLQDVAGKAYTNQLKPFDYLSFPLGTRPPVDCPANNSRARLWPNEGRLENLWTGRGWAVAAESGSQGRSDKSWSEEDPRWGHEVVDPRK